MFPRMGTYELQPMMHAGRPVYAYRSPEFGVAYMYYDNLTPTEQYWIVGTSVGSPDANFGAADSSARSPDLVRYARHFHSSSRLTVVPCRFLPSGMCQIQKSLPLMQHQMSRLSAQMEMLPHLRLWST